jgi:hypothetical protein
LGYDVVEVVDEPGPASPAGPPSPWSPVGYGVVLVGEERDATGYRAVPIAEEGPADWATRVARRARNLTLPPARSPRPPLYAIAIAGGGLILVACLGVLAAVSRPMWRSAASGGDEWRNGRVVAASRVPEDVADPGNGELLLGRRGHMRGFLHVRIPEVDPAAAEEKVEAPPAVGKDEAQAVRADIPPAERETFGTAVGFVRNPQAAARLAGAEGKLTFLLHVSGNFEDDRFT